MNFRLITPSKSYEEEWINYAKEYIKDNPKLLPLEYKFDISYDEWLKLIEDESVGKNLKKGRVASSKYFLVNNENKILGGISIRHNIDTEYLFNYGGHIGYGIRPSERGKGYGNIILSLGLNEVKKMNINKILVTCLDDNIYSKKIIEKNGGILENKISFEDNFMCRYWIKL